jgi:enoyl-CoA hydratase
LRWVGFSLMDDLATDEHVSAHNMLVELPTGTDRPPIKMSRVAERPLRRRGPGRDAEQILFPVARPWRGRYRGDYEQPAYWIGAASVEFSHLEQRLNGDTVVITMNRPPVNAVNQAMYTEIRDLFGRFDEHLPGAKAVILTGAGKHFCAGNDLDEFLTLDSVNSAGRMRLVRDAFNAVYDCPVPVIAAVRGVALGTGLALAASCDLIVAADDARFGTPEVGVGVMGGARHASRLLPEPVTRLMYYTADPIPAAEMRQYGAVVDVVDGAALLGTCLELAARITRHSRVALRHAKESLNTIEPMDLKSGYEYEQRMTGRLVGHRDAQEAVQAVAQRRPAKYQDE